MFLDHREHQVSQEQLDPQDLMVQKEILVHQENRELLDLLECLDLWDHLEEGVKMAGMELVENLVPKETRETLVIMVPQDFQERKGRGDLQVQ